MVHVLIHIGLGTTPYGSKYLMRLRHNDVLPESFLLRSPIPQARRQTCSCCLNGIASRMPSGFLPPPTLLKRCAALA